MNDYSKGLENLRRHLRIARLMLLSTTRASGKRLVRVAIDDANGDLKP